MVKGAHKVQPETKSNNPIPTAPAMAAFLGPNKKAAIKSIAVPRWTKPPFAVIGSLIFSNRVATNTSAISIAVKIKLKVFLREWEPV